VERYGPDDNDVIYLVARSWSKRASTDITVSSDDLGWPANPDVTVTELLYVGSPSTSYDGNGNLVISTGTINRKDNRVYKLVPNFGPQPPVAEFSGNPTAGPAPLPVSFTDLSSGSPTSWDWTFGDGGTDTVQHPSHEYTAENSYTVSLTAHNSQGQDTETKVDYITVASLSCHVGAIDLVGMYKSTGPPSGRGYYAEATIAVHDQDCQPLSGVTVDITWSGCVSGSDSDTTDQNGQVIFESPKDSNGGTFQCCVDNLTKSGYPYQSGDNHETCDSIVNP
jgi:PKD repeat protein